MAYGIHKMSNILYQYEGLRALSRTNSGGDTNATTYAGGASGTTTYLASEVLDLTTIANNTILTKVSAGTVGTSLDGKWVESDDQSTWTAVTGGAMTQLTAAGLQSVEISPRSFTKRYAKFVVTLGGTCVFSVMQTTIKKLIGS